MKIFLVIPFLIFVNAHSFACSCIGQSSLRQEIKKTRAIFIGFVADSEVFVVKQDILPVTIKMVKYSMIVKAVYKGRFIKRNVQIVTGMGKGDCGFSFKKGKEYVVYADYESDFFSRGSKLPRYLATNICKRTKDKEKAQDELILLAKYRKPKIIGS